MKVLSVLMLLMTLAMSSYGIALKSFSMVNDECLMVNVDTGIVVSRKVAEGCFRCVVELKMARDSLATYMRIDDVNEEAIGFIVAEVSKKKRFVMWVSRGKKTLRDVGIGILLGVMLVKLPP